jgi:hypothetical protein
MSRSPRIMTSLAFVGALVAAALALTACAPTQPSGDGPQLLGVVTTVDAAGKTPQLLVVWDTRLGGQLEYDAASLAVPRSANVFRRNTDASYTRFPAQDLKVGDVVEVRITGPVRESYPVQADADQIVVTGRWPSSRPLPMPPGLAPPK